MQKSPIFGGEEFLREKFNFSTAWLWVLEVLFHIQAVVENADHDNLGFCASSVKDDMTALAKLFVSRFYVFRIAANFRLSRKEPKSIIKLLEVFVALTLSSLLSGKAANINDIFSIRGGEREWRH